MNLHIKAKVSINRHSSSAFKGKMA